MSKLKVSDVTHVAKLANLKLTDKQLETFRKQLSEVIDYIEMLNEVDTSNIEPTSQTTGLENVTREDKVKVEQGLSREEALSGSEEVYSGYFKVPMILKEKSDK